MNSVDLENNEDEFLDKTYTNEQSTRTPTKTDIRTDAFRFTFALDNDVISVKQVRIAYEPVK